MHPSGTDWQRFPEALIRALLSKSFIFTHFMPLDHIAMGPLSSLILNFPQPQDTMGILSHFTLKISLRRISLVTWLVGARTILKIVSPKSKFYLLLLFSFLRRKLLERPWSAYCSSVLLPKELAVILRIPDWGLEELREMHSFLKKGYWIIKEYGLWNPIITSWTLAFAPVPRMTLDLLASIIQE